MHLLKAFNLLMAFILELCMLVAFGYFGFSITQNTFLRYGVGVGLPLVAAVLWGKFAAPKSEHRLKGRQLYILKMSIFVLSSFLLVVAEEYILGTLFIALAGVSVTLATFWGQEKDILKL